MADLSVSENKDAKLAKKLKNYVAIVLDRSGSMGTMQQEAIDAFNEQVDKIREESHDMATLVSFVTFGSFVTPEFWNNDPDKLDKLTTDTYRPDGMTSMLDAVAMTVLELKKVPDVDDEDTSFLLIVISDGQENNSKQYDWHDVAELLQDVQKTNRWTVTYLGANQDLSRLASSLKIAKGNVKSFAGTKAGMKTGSADILKGMSAFYASRRVGKKSLTSFYDGDDNQQDSQ